MSKLSGLVLILMIPALAHATVWETLTSIHPASAKPTAQIQKVIDQPVDLTGYTIIDEFSNEELSDFLFTATPNGCIHDPLPPPNRLIHAKMLNGKIAPEKLSGKITLHGKLSMSSRSDSTYEFLVDSVK